MNIFDNPFFILEVSMRDNRQQIISAAEDKIFMDESKSQAVNQARNTLIIPEKRLAAELRWFPGIDDNRIKSIIKFFRGDKSSKLNISDFRNIALLNIAVYIFRTRRFKTLNDIVNSILAAGKCFETINAGDLCRIINMDRASAGFQQVSISELERGLYDYRSDVVKVLDNRVSVLSQNKYIELAEELAGKFANEAAYQESVIINDLIDSYELRIMPGLESQQQMILDVLNNFKRCPEKLSEQYYLDALGSNFTKWKKLSQPLILAAKNRGLDNDNLFRLGAEILNSGRELIGEKILNIEAQNELSFEDKINRLQTALNLMFVLRDHLSDSSTKIHEAVGNDIKELNEIMNKIKEIIESQTLIKQQEERERAASIYYETEIYSGSYSHKLIISAKGISWQGKVTPLQNIIGARWGGVRNYTDIRYEIAFQSLFSTRIINFNDNPKHFNEIVSHLFNAVFATITAKILTQLREGQTLQIGAIKFNDNGVFLSKEGWLFSDKKFFMWDSVITCDDNGSFIIKDSTGKYSASASFMNDMNAPIFNIMLSTLRDNGFAKFSDLPLPQ